MRRAGALSGVRLMFGNRGTQRSLERWIDADRQRLADLETEIAYLRDRLTEAGSLICALEDVVGAMYDGQPLTGGRLQAVAAQAVEEARARR